MARAIPTEIARRRRQRLSELIDALGAARGAKVTQREFAATIGREQGTIAAILGDHRALGGDVMLAIVKTYGLAVDYFDSPIAPDPRVAIRASQSAAAAAVVAPKAPKTQAPRVPEDPALAEALEALRPDRAVAMVLEQLWSKGGRFEADGWIRQGIAAQSAHERAVLLDWFDEAVARLQRAEARAESRPEPARTQPSIVKVSEKSSKGLARISK